MSLLIIKFMKLMTAIKTKILTKQKIILMMGISAFMAAAAFLIILNSRENDLKPTEADKQQKYRQTDIAKISDEWQGPVFMKSINTTGWEDGAYISADGKTLYFVYMNIDLLKLPEIIKNGPNRDSKKTCRPACGQYPRIDLFYSTKNLSGKWQTPKPHPLTVPRPVGGLVLANENKAYFHMEKDDGLKTEIYFAEKSGGKWQSPQKISALSSAYKDDDPHVTSDENEIFFWSDRPGMGRTDIYVSKKINGEWQKPMPLPPPINGPSNDMQPFLRQNILYFASDRDGKPKIYKSERIGENWGIPKIVIESNFAVGEPTLTADGKFLYFVQIFQSESQGHNADIFYLERK